MKVLLVNSLTTGARVTMDFVHPPLGLLYIAAYARRHLDGLEIKVLDGPREGVARIVEEIRIFNPDVLGISTTTQGAREAYRIANEARGINPSLLIVCGGPHPTIMPHEGLQQSATDIIVMGEGEITFLEILRNFNRGSKDNSILGTALWADGEIKVNAHRPPIEDLDSIPFPARDLLDLKSYPGHFYKKLKLDTSLISARGCPFDCVFCSNPVWKLQKPWYRARSPENVVDEMEEICTRFGISEFFDVADEFNANLNWAKAVCDEIVRRGLDISWKVHMRAGNMDDELARKMAKAGCWLGMFGVESGNDRTLRGIKKNVTVAQIEEALTMFKNHGMKTLALLMAFNVWEENGELRFENKEDSKLTLAFARKLIRENKIDLFSWSMTTPFPGSHLWGIALKHSLIPDKALGKWEIWDPDMTLIMNLPGVTEHDWIEVQNEGKRLQAVRLLLSGTMNASAMPLYAKKTFLLGARTVSRALRRLSQQIHLSS
ncbi:MAG: radical SAM protein [Dehalococcoidia bacterium]|nr:radical SAM protein [Dehalococcoidia bacterium]